MYSITTSKRLEKKNSKVAEEENDDEEIDVISNDENSRLSQGTTVSASSSNQGVFPEESYSSTSNSAMDLSASSQASCSSFARPSPLGNVSVTKLSRKRSNLGLTIEDNESEDGEIASRKEKSLGLLCKKFLETMGEEAQTGKDVHLETVAKKMMVEKRRIYDIVNVMEALEAMSKTNKSYYRWHGLTELPHLMALLQRQAEEENLLSRIRRVEQAMCSFTELPSGNKRLNADIVGTLVGNKSASNSDSVESSGIKNRIATSDCGAFVEDSKSGSIRARSNKNSLAQLCRRFLMVLLCNPKDMRRVSLDVASTVLIKDPENEGFEPPSRSRCRRLYDIANVLVAMGIIQKVHYLFGTKKIPLFVYSGPEPGENRIFRVEEGNSSDESGVVAEKRGQLRKCAEELEIPKKRFSHVDSNHSYSSPLKTSSTINLKSELDLLVVASEQHGKQNRGIKKALKVQTEEANDENANPAKMSHSVKVIRTSSGAIIVRPEAKKFVKHPSFNILESKLPSNNFENDVKPILKAENENQFIDSRQLHAFQKIDQRHSNMNFANLSGASFFPGVNVRHTVYPSFGVTSSYPTLNNSFASAYSVNALLSAPVVNNSYQLSTPYTVLQPKVTENVLPKPRSVLGDISRSFNQNN